MKYIKIFIASSVVEFQYERKDLGDYIRSLNDIYVEKGIYFKLTICEDVSNAVEMERKQEAYNQSIRDSQFFYVIFGKEAGQFTIEEFEVALKQFRDSGSPRIYTYFMQLPDGIKPAKSVTDFMKRLDQEIGHYYTVFSSLDSIKLNMLMELARFTQIDEHLAFSDGHACVDGTPVLSLEGIPAYRANETLHRGREQLAELNRQFALLAAKYAADPSNSALLEEMMDLGGKRSKLSDRLHQMEMDLLSLFSTVERIKGNQQAVNWWEREAGRLLDAGDSEGALAVLRDAQLQQEAQQAQALLEKGKERIRAVIRANLLRIKILKSKGITADSAEEILSVYKQTAELAEQIGQEMDCLGEYSLFLRHQGDYDSAIKVQLRLKNLCELSGKERSEYVNVIQDLAVLYAECKQFRDAEPLLLECLDIYKSLSREKNFALTCHSLGILYHDMKDTAKSREYLEQTLELLRKLNDGSDGDRCKLGFALSATASLYAELGLKDSATRLAQECYDLFAALERENPGKYEHELAKEAENLACHYSDFGEQLNRKMQLHREALTIHRRLAEQNPDAHQQDVAHVLSNMGMCIFYTKPQKAEELLREALSIRRVLYARNPLKFASPLATLCSNLAVLVSKKDPAETEALLVEAYQIRKKLMEEYEGAYGKQFSDVCNNLAVFYKSRGDIEKAMSYIIDAIQIGAQWVTDHPDIPDGCVALASSYINLANMLDMLHDDPEDVQTIYDQAVSIAERLYIINQAEYQGTYVAALSALALYYDNHDHNDLALPLWEKIWESCKTYRVLNEAASNAATNIAMDLAEKGQYEQSIALLQEAVQLYRNAAADNFHVYTPYVAQLSCNIGAVYSRFQPEEHINLIHDHYQLAAELYESLIDLGNFDHARHLFGVYKNMGGVCGYLGTSEAFFRRVIENTRRWYAKAPEHFSYYLSAYLFNLANHLYHQNNDRTESKKLLEEALSFTEKHPYSIMLQLQQKIKSILSSAF